MVKPFSFDGILINPGERCEIELPAPSYAQIHIQIPIHILHGKKSGPCIFVIAAVHGDEINGTEIIRRLLRQPCLKHLHGTLIAIPVANMHGFITLSRYLPDRRDLNRSFPGSKRGSLAYRLAHLFMDKIISRCQYGIDLHTGNVHSENLPHIRANLHVPGALKIAKAFGTPVIINAKLRDGSIRQAATDLHIPVIVYEGGEAMRFNELAIRIGLRGIINVLRSVRMIPLDPPGREKKKIKPKISSYTTWVRSPKSGIFYAMRSLGSDIEKGEQLGVIHDPFFKKKASVYSPIKGIIIGQNVLPLVNEGDALIHVAQLKRIDEVASEINKLRNNVISNPFEYI